MGSAGIIRELLRFSRAADGADPSYAVTWADHIRPARSLKPDPAGPPGGRARERQSAVHVASWVAFPVKMSVVKKADYCREAEDYRTYGHEKNEEEN